MWRGELSLLLKIIFVYVILFVDLRGHPAMLSTSYRSEAYVGEVGIIRHLSISSNRSPRLVGTSISAIPSTAPLISHRIVLCAGWKNS